MPNPVIVADYDPGWPAAFESLRRRIAAALGELAVAIEHVGSTAVAGLAAKPIVDMDVLITSSEVLPAAIQRLADLGYAHEGDLGIPEREAFRAQPNDPAHHLYLCHGNRREFDRHPAFRDYLRAHPKEAAEYGNLKRSLAARFRDNRAAYMAGKAGFIESFLAGSFALNDFVAPETERHHHRTQTDRDRLR